MKFAYLIEILTTRTDKKLSVNSIEDFPTLDVRKKSSSKELPVNSKETSTSHKKNDSYTNLSAKPKLSTESSNSNYNSNANKNSIPSPLPSPSNKSNTSNPNSNIKPVPPSPSSKRTNKFEYKDDRFILEKLETIFNKYKPKFSSQDKEDIEDIIDLFKNNLDN